ncbi:MAG: squalene synthase HpnC [Gammaproteobacteria bacterium]|nr:squalene synthase HpnC [Gammaproteobacteria bacterium]
MTPELAAAYAHCQQIANNHYENFPVASKLLPAHMRRPFAAVYAYSRHVDDLADEGDASAQQRFEALDDYGQQLDRAIAGHGTDDKILLANVDVIRQHNIPIALYHDLITAFKQDVQQKRYTSHADVLQYCRYSANPVGRILLHLAGEASEQNLRDSDDVCSALQLINFLQDMQQDFHELGRIYLPQSDMDELGVTEHHLRNAVSDQAMRALFKREVARAETLILRGASLGWRLKGRFGLEIRLIIGGGLRILHRLKQLETDVFERPRLRKWDGLWMLWFALRRQAPAATVNTKLETS